MINHRHNNPPPLRNLQTSAEEHDKESSELVVDGSLGIDGSVIVDEEESAVASSTTNTATTTIPPTTTTTISAEEQQAYEKQFVQEPTGETTTSYSLFESGDAFTPDAITSKRHYMKNDIVGQLWLDVDMNGKRGSFTDSTLNAREQDSGITGVDAIVLVNCDTNQEVAVTKSQPVSADGDVTIQKVTETGGRAGNYRFPEVMNAPGRYYIAYKAPSGFRINAGALPTTEEKVEYNSEGVPTYFECPLVGGEGETYYEDALSNGDFDNRGYCGRSVGCFEVGKKADIEQKFKDLVEVDDAGVEVASNSSTFGPDDMVVVYPDQHMLDIGLSEQVWPLDTQQFAEIEVDLVFPKTSTEAVTESLGETLESDSALAESTTVQAIERTLESTITTSDFSSVELEVEGVSMTTTSEHEKTSEETLGEPTRRNLRASRKLQDLVDSSGSNADGVTVVTYKFTARGGYKPPPHLQLGKIVEDSINSDQRKLTKSLQDKIGQGLPDVFAQLENVDSRHLTVKEDLPSVVEMLNDQSQPTSTMASWATVPVILLAVFISGLIGLFFFRRAFSRRRAVHHKDLEDDLEKGKDDDDKKERLKDDPMDDLIVVDVDKAEDVPANMASSGTSGSSGNSEERNNDSSERRRKKSKRKKSRAREIADSIKRSFTLEPTDSILSDISDHEEKKRKRRQHKKAMKEMKESSRRMDDSEKKDDGAGGSDERRRRSSRRSTRRVSDKLRESLKRSLTTGDVERRRKKKHKRHLSEGELNTEDRPSSTKSKSRRRQKSEEGEEEVRLD